MDSSFDELTVEKFVEMIRGIVKDVLKEERLKSRTESYYNGVVTSVNGDVATVDIGDNVLAGIPNKTGVTLSTKDAVRVYASSPTLTDAYIGIKLN